MAMNKEERQAFLAHPHIGALSIEAGADRAPLVVPIWYQYSPGGDLWFLTGAESRKISLLRAAGRCTVMAEVLSPTIAYAAASGPVIDIVDGTKDELTEMAARYLPADKVAGYVESASFEDGSQTKVVVRPQQWVASDLGSI